ncbi:MAG: hypothetical protein J6X31_00960 [Bacteroidales bacterium]|nr:hypothetical protein [Bacteroidales bacterium]MBP5679608.1 hypothetical protein [Bacteroidales bacterium]
MKNNKLKVLLYWALVVTMVFMAINVVFAGVQLADSLLNMEQRNLSSNVSLYGYGVTLIRCSHIIVVDSLYLVFLFISIRGLKRDTFFNKRNAYFLACIAGISLLTTIISGVFGTMTMGTLTYAIFNIFSVGPSAFILCLALLYLAAVRAEETEKLTI